MKYENEKSASIRFNGMASQQIAPTTTYVVRSRNFYGKNHFVPGRTRKI